MSLIMNARLMGKPRYFQHNKEGASNTFICLQTGKAQLASTDRAFHCKKAEQFLE